jgi:tetratricopeptide (TPR) repeat protein
MNPDKLTQWLKTATGPLVACGALVGAVVGGATFLEEPLAKVSFIGQQWALALAVLLPVAAAVVLLWASFRIVMRKSRLLRPERFDLRVRDRDDLFGRDRDIEDLQELVESFALVFVDGESGSGKSSLVGFGLVPELAKGSGLLPVLVAQYRGDWDLGLSQQVYGLLWAGLGESDRARLGVAERPAVGSVGAASVERLLADVASKLGRQTLLIFDQFDDYQLAHRARFLSEQRAWIPAAALTEANSFWKAIEGALTAGHIRLMVVTRSDASAGLHSVRFTQANASRPVLRLAATWLPRLLDQLTADDGKGPVVGDPDSGWTDLKRLIELDLDRGNGILPQQVRTTLLGMRELRALAPSDYRRAGRAAGAEALYIRDSIKWAAQTGGLSERQVRSLLLALVERGEADGAKTRLRSDGELAALVADDDARHKALARLTRDEVVREFDEGGMDASRWQLDHDYLAAAVIAEERLTNPNAAVLRDKADAWERTAGMGLWQRYRALLPVGTQLALAWAKIRSWRRFSYQPYRRFAALSLLKPAPLILIAAAAGGWALWLSSPSYQIRQMIAEAPHVKGEESIDGLGEWAAALTLSGRAEEALALARAVDEPKLRSQVLGNVASALNAMGDTEQAGAIAREAVADARRGSGPNEGPDLDLAMVVDVMSNAGDRDGALALLRWARKSNTSLPSSGTGSAYQAVEFAKMFRRLGRKDEALATLRQARDNIGRARNFFLSAAEEFHRNGDDREALALASAPAPAQGTISEAVIHAQRAEVYRTLGLADRQAAEMRAAVDARNEQVPHYTADTLLPRLLVRNGRPDAVFLFLGGYGSVHQVDILTSAATEASRLGQAAQVGQFMRRAEELARGASDPLERAQILVAVARGFAAQANPNAQRAALVDALAAARAAAEGASSIEAKLDVLVEIAVKLARLAPDDAARSALAEAAALSRRMTEDPSDYLSTLAGAMALAGQLEEARLTAEQVRGGTERLDAFTAVLSNYAQYRDPSLSKRLEAGARREVWEDE